MSSCQKTKMSLQISYSTQKHSTIQEAVILQKHRLSLHKQSRNAVIIIF